MVESVDALNRAPQRDVAGQVDVGAVEGDEQEAVRRPRPDSRHLGQSRFDLVVGHGSEALVAQASVGESLRERPYRRALPRGEPGRSKHLGIGRQRLGRCREASAEALLDPTNDRARRGDRQLLTDHLEDERPERIARRQVVHPGPRPEARMCVDHASQHGIGLAQELPRLPIGERRARARSRSKAHTVPPVWLELDGQGNLGRGADRVSAGLAVRSHPANGPAIVRVELDAAGRRPSVGGRVHGMISPMVEPLADDVDHVRGEPGTPVILEYGDYECPYSRQAFRSIERVERELSGRVRFAFRHFPLTQIHPHALAAAAGAEAAARQGRFWEMHELLFHRQKALEDDDLRSYAGELGLDLRRFEQDRKGDEVLRPYRSRRRERRSHRCDSRHTDAVHRRRPA